MTPDGNVSETPGSADRPKSLPPTIRNMDQIQYLREFITLSEDLHFGKAAEREHVSQPTLSQHLAQLERMLGVHLIDRSGHIARLTEAGRVVLAETRRTVKAYEQLREVAQQASRGVYGTVRIGYCTSSAEFVLRLLAALHSIEPGLHLSTRAGHSGPILEALQHGEIDIAFARTTAETAGQAADQMQTEAVRTDPLLVVLPDRHPAASNREITAADLDESTYFHASRSECPALHDFVLHRVFTPVGAQYDDVHVASLVDALAYVTARQGFTVIYASEAPSLPVMGTVRRPLRTPTAPPVLCAVWDESREQAMLDLVMRAARRLSAQASARWRSAAEMPLAARQQEERRQEHRVA
jgi:DNA-binding transcriptional LysR family regulator